jgi:hypothetical protein
MNPLARKEKLTIRELPDEAVIYDLERNKMHCLNRTAVLIWKHCDGRHDPAALAAILTRELLLSADEAAAATRLALDQLGRRHLLTAAVSEPPDDERLSRREALRKIAVTAAAVLPLVMTLKAPSVAWAANAAGTCFIDGDCAKGQTCKGAIQPGPHLSKVAMPGECVGPGASPPPTSAPPPPSPGCGTQNMACTGTGQGTCFATCDCLPSNSGGKVCFS